MNIITFSTRNTKVLIQKSNLVFLSTPTGQGCLREDQGGGDRLQPPAEQGLNDPHEGPLLNGAEQELKPWCLKLGNFTFVIFVI